MSGINDLWGDEDDLPKKTTKKKSNKKTDNEPKREAVQEAASGFRIQLGVCRRRAKDVVREVPILLAKDRMCWILRIGSSQSYPTSLVGVFETVAQQEAIELNSDATIEDLIADARDTEGRIREMGTTLDKRIRAFIVKKLKDT